MSKKIYLVSIVYSASQSHTLNLTVEVTEKYSEVLGARLPTFIP